VGAVLLDGLNGASGSVQSDALTPTFVHEWLLYSDAGQLGGVLPAVWLNPHFIYS